ncbi:MAG: DUF5704 domain-containing protein [Mobilitalea sp.]
MKYFVNKQLLRRFITYVLLFCLLVANISCNKCNYSEAAEVTSDWLINDSEGKEIKSSKIEWTVTHHLGSVNYPRYRTLYYYMSNTHYSTSIKFTSGSNAAIQKKMLIVIGQPLGEADANGNIKYLYSISRDAFMQAAASSEVGITHNNVLSGNATIYLNPVFERYTGKYVAEGETDIFGLQEMLAFNWSVDTQSLLPDMYNESFSMTAQNIYNVSVIAVDKDGKSLQGATDTVNNKIEYPLYQNKLIAYEPFTFTLPNSYSTLKKDNITYTYDHYEYYYTQRDPVTNVTSNPNPSKTASFSKSPDALPGSTLTIKMVYEKKELPYYYRIEAVDNNHAYLGNIVTGPQQTTSGSLVTYGSTIARTFSGKVYSYMNQWYLTYTDPAGNIIKGPVKPNSIRQDSMPLAKENSTAVFSMVYGVGPTPTPGPTSVPVPTTPPSATPTIAPPASPSPVAPDSASMPFTDVVNTGVIRADNRGAERFTANAGVPTTESLFGEVLAKRYLLGYNFIKKVGIKYFNVKVKKDYILQWYTATPVSAGGKKMVTETVSVEQTVSVPRAYGYWEINNLECYKISNAVLNNYALPGGSITIYPNSGYYSPPTINVSHSGNETDHIIPPTQVASGITLAAQTVTSSGSNETKKPTIPVEDFTNLALTQTGKAKVRSDSLTFNGVTVISAAITDTEAPGINLAAIPQCYDNINNNVLYKPNNIIAATKENGTYASNGVITYTSVATVNATRPSNPQYSVDGINQVIIHTPVICKPSITADNDKYVQLKNPREECVQLVIDPDATLSDFIVNISNTGHHSGKQGYFTRDFSRSLREPAVSYISAGSGLLKNQVKFPFNVYIDKGVANVCTDDDFIEAGTWIVIDRSSPRFYLPMTVNEGVYTVQFRTIAVNGEPFLTSTEKYANTQLRNYVATDTINVEISGRIYGLSVYDLSDYPMWEDAFRVKNSLDFKKDVSTYTDGTAFETYSSGRSYTYSLGTNDQYGNDTGRSNKFTFPLVNGSHPQYKNIGILKTGYMVRFSLKTTGNMFSDACKVSIKPNFYYVDKDGKNRKAVDLYYTEGINNKTKYLVKVGSSIDQTNLKTYSTGDLYLGIPEAELKQTAALRGKTLGKFIAGRSMMFNFSDIRLNYAFRTYINNAYTAKVKAYSSFGKVHDAGISEGDIQERMQKWYGQYYVPNEVHVVAKGFDVMDYVDKYGVDYTENFWLKDGYIIVNFTIETVGEDGKRRLSYINANNYKDNENCSMWTLEGPIMSKKSYKGPTFTFYAGDFIVYYANKRMTDDYEAGAIY